MSLDIEGVLAAHELVGTGEDFRHRAYDECACGSRHPRYGDGRYPTHRAHVAAVLREQIVAAQAEAWEACWEAIASAAWVDPMTRAHVLDLLLDAQPAAQVAPSRVGGES